MYQALAGLAIGSLGQMLSGFGADMKKKNVEALASFPGLDIGGITGTALDDILGQYPKISGIASKVNQFNYDQLQSLLDKSMPGYAARQKTQAGVIDDYLAGRVPKSLQDLLHENTAIRALAGNWSEPMMGANLADSLLRQGINLQSLGLGAANQFATRTRGTDIPNLMSPSDLMVNPAQYLNIRGHERDQQLAAMGLAAQMPGQTEGWGGFLAGMGGLMAGGGMGSLFGGGGGGASSSPSIYPIGVSGPYGGLMGSYATPQVGLSGIEQLF